MPTGRSPSKCLPLGTSSTISVCRGTSMAQRPPRNTTLTPMVRYLWISQFFWLSLGSWSSLSHEVNGHNTSLRGSLGTDRHMKAHWNLALSWDWSLGGVEQNLNTRVPRTSRWDRTISPLHRPVQASCWGLNFSTCEARVPWVI